MQVADLKFERVIQEKQNGRMPAPTWSGEPLRRTNANNFPILPTVHICSSKHFQKLLFIHVKQITPLLWTQNCPIQTNQSQWHCAAHKRPLIIIT